MLKVNEIRAALLADPTGCGDDCCRIETAHMLDDIERMRGNEPPQMSEQEMEEVRGLRNRILPSPCTEGCVWLERLRGTTFLYFDVLARWRYDQKQAS